MATYKEIKGVTVQTLDSDPELNVGSWASGGNMNTARRAHLGVGITTAGLAAAGRQDRGRCQHTPMRGYRSPEHGESHPVPPRGRR